mgnify:CR=1 FL=1
MMMKRNENENEKRKDIPPGTSRSFVKIVTKTKIITINNWRINSV